MDTLIIESFFWTPHLETAGEIAITEVMSGKKVGFCFIYSDNPDLISRNPLDKFKTLIGVGCRTKIKNLEKILIQHGVEIIQESPLTSNVVEDIRNFVFNSPLNLDELRKYEYKGAKLGLSVVSSLISKLRCSEPDVTENAHLIQEYLLSSATVFEKTKSVLQKIRPQKIISFNGRFACCKPIFEAADQMDIQLQYHERGATFNRYEIFNKQPHDFAYIREEVKSFWEKADSSKEEIAHRFFQRKKQGDGIGWTSFVEQQQKGLVPQQVSKRKVVYFSSSDDEFAAIGDLIKHPIFSSQKHAIQNLISWVSNQQDCHLTIRVHPHISKKSLADITWWSSSNLKGRNVEVISPDSEVDSYALIDWADVVVSYGSTIGVEATYWGKPSIMIGDSTYSGFGCVYEPKSMMELYHLLEVEDLKPLPQVACLPYGFYSLSMGKVYKYYNPHDLFSGDFLGTPLTPYPKYLPYLYLRRLYHNFSSFKLQAKTKLV